LHFQTSYEIKRYGVEVWFMPVTPISEKNRKERLAAICSSYVDTNPEFGTVDEFKALVN
jgi:hypothetical protein